MTFIVSVTGADIEPLWIDDQHFDGLDPEQRLTLAFEAVPAIRVIERILRRHSAGPTSATWQFAPTGELQIGPKSRLNEFATLRLYDVHDLLFRVGSFRDIPNLGLGQITQGQGGSQQSDIEEVDRDAPSESDRASMLVGLITRFVEPDQWETAGGDGATILFHNGALLVRAPEYIHRQIGGPAPRQSSRR